MNHSFQRLTLCAALFLTGCGVTGIVQAQNAVEGSFERILSVSGPVDLDVSTGSGSIDVHAGDSSRVEIQAIIRVGARYRGRLDATEVVKQLELNPPVEQTGSSIRIGRIDNPDYERNVSINYKIVVPNGTKLRSHTGSGSQAIAGIEGPVDANTGSGSVTVSEINFEVHAETGSGAILVNNVRSSISANTGSGSIVAENIGGGFRGATGSGSIRVVQTASGDVEASTGSGSVALSGVKGSLRARTGSGGITVDGEPAGNWDLQASSGSIVVRLPQQAAFNLDARTASGGVVLDHPVTIQGRIRRNEVVGTVRGGGFALNVRTGSGGIRIE